MRDEKFCGAILCIASLLCCIMTPMKMVVPVPLPWPHAGLFLAIYARRSEGASNA